MKLRPHYFLPAFILAGSISTLHGQLFFTGGTNSYLTPSFRGGGGAEYSRWDVMYSPHTEVNYPDIAAPNGIKQLRSTAGFTGNSVFTPLDPLAFWHTDNPTLLQTGGVASGAFIIGPGSAGNIYSFGAATSFEIADSTPYASAGTVNFQWQTDGQPMDYSTLQLVYNDGTADVFLSPTNMVLEYKSASSAFGFASMVRASAQWDLTGLNIANYKVVFASGSSSMSFQEAVLDTAATYVEVTPGARTWQAGGSDQNWSTAGNWQNNAISSPGSNVTFSGGSSVIVDSARMVGELTIATPGNLTIGGGSALTVNTGINVTAPGEHTISAPVFMGGFNINHVAEGATLTLAGTLGNNSTNSGGPFYKSGSGTLVLAAANTFTGSVMLDGGTLRLGHAGALNAATPAGIGFVAGAAPNTRLQLNGYSVTVGGLATTTDALGTDPGLPVVENGSSTNVVLTINPIEAASFGGILRDGGSGRVSLVKAGSNTQTFTGPNSYTGGTTVTGGFLAISSDTALGAVPISATPGNIVLNGAGLATVNHSFSLDANRGIAIGPDSGAGSGTLQVERVGGTLTVDGVLADNGSGTGSLIKTRAGTLVLGSANTYSGSTTVMGGLLSVTADNRLGVVPGAATPGKIVLNGGGLLATESFTLASTRGLVLGPAGSAGTGFVTVASGKTLSYGGVIANNGGTGGLVKNGPGTFALSGVSTYTGPTALYGGTLQLDFAAATASTNLISSNSALQGLSGTLSVKGKSSGTSSQTFASTAFSSGHSNIAVDSNGAGGTMLNLNAITRSAGTTANFTLPAAGSITTTTSTLTNGVLTSAASPNGVVYATVGGTDWATVSSGNIATLGTYETSAAFGDWATTENVALSENATGVNTATINTLKLISGADVTLNSAQTLTLGVGGLLVTGSGASEITGGTLRGASGSTKELVVFQNNTASDFIIGSVVANNSTATGLTKAGDGTLLLTGTNTYTGITRILGGVVSVGSLANGGVSGHLGAATNAATNLVIDGGILRYTGATTSTNRAFTIGINGATIEASGSGPLTISGAASFSATNVPRTFTLGGTNTGDNTLSGAIGNNGDGATALAKGGSGTWLLSGANSFTGGITIREGTLKLGNAGALNSATPNHVAFDVSAPAGTKLQLNGFGSTIGGLSSAATTAVVENGGAANAALAIVHGENLTFAGSLQDGGVGTLALTKSGPGSLTLTGVNNYTGPTVVSGGTLEVGGVGGRLSATTSVEVNGSGTLLLSGTAADRLNDVTTTLNGGAVAFDSSLYGATESLGALILTSDSSLDFGSLAPGAGNHGNTFLFDSLTLNGHKLAIYNWSGSTYPNGGGVDGGSLLQDRLLFGGDISSQVLSQISFYSDGGSTLLGSGQQISFGGDFEIVPVPEPATTGLLAAAALFGLIGFRERRRVAQVMLTRHS